MKKKIIAFFSLFPWPKICLVYILLRFLWVLCNERFLLQNFHRFLRNKSAMQSLTYDSSPFCLLLIMSGCMTHILPSFCSVQNTFGEGTKNTSIHRHTFFEDDNAVLAPEPPNRRAPASCETKTVTS